MSLHVSKSALAVLLATLGISSASARPCPPYEVARILLDSQGVLTRTEYREVTVVGEKGMRKVWKDVVTDRMTLGDLDQVTLNAAPEMQDASLQVRVQREAANADAGGILSTTYLVREILTSSWSGEVSEKVSRVTVASDYLGNGKYGRACGKLAVKALSSNRPKARRAP